MTRALALAAALAVTAPGCASLVQHPVPTLAVVGGAIGFGTCEMDAVKVGTCGIIGASTAVFLGGVAALVYLFTEQPTPQMEGEEVEPDERAPRRHHAPIVLPPGPDDGPPGAQLGSGSADGSGSAGSGSDVAP